MNRRNFVKGSSMLVSLSAGTLISELPGLVLIQLPVKVEVLKHMPNTRYETLRTYSTRKEAEDLVKALQPRLVSATCVVDPEESRIVALRSGYRDAVRSIYKANEIIQTVYEIIDTRSKEIVIPWHYDEGTFIFDCGRAWSIIENIRVDGEPVQMPGHLSPYLMQPFDRGTPNIRYIDRQGNEIDRS